MTNEEAIEYLKQADTTVYKKIKSKTAEALEIAIQALEQQPSEEDIHREREQAYMLGYEDASKRFRTEPSEDCISRQAVLNGLASIAKAKAKSDAQKSLMGRVMFFTEQLPPVTPQRPKGKWNISVYETLDGQGLFECSNCGETDFYYDKKYCPNCGSYNAENKENEND